MDIFDQIRTNVKANNDTLLKFIQEIESLAKANRHQSLCDFLSKSKDKILNDLALLEENTNALYPSLEKELRKETSQLKKKIAELQREKEMVASDNLILELKKKNLLKLTADLEEAYEEISKRTDLLNQAHSQVLDKNKELELGKEALLDQTEYLHEANETISKMHEEVQQQREVILKKNEELLSLNNEKNNLIGIVAHDLKSPLNQIKGLVTLIKVTSTGLDKDTSQYIDMMESSLGKLSNMINKILDVEAIESRKMNLRIERVNISEILKNVISLFQHLAAEKEILLHDQISAAFHVRADQDYLDQVFQNLISNAIKFSKNNKNIFVSVFADNEKVICEIRDEGPGLSEDDKRKLFGKYQKLSAKPTGNETSTGLGLSIVKKFVESMNGEIWCESEEGKGASFFVAFNKD